MEIEKSKVSDKWLLLQPAHHNGVIPIDSGGWVIDPFMNTARCINAPMYNIMDKEIPADYDIYWFVHFSVGDIEAELALMKAIKEQGKKIFLTFSHDLRFLIGDGLMNIYGTLFTDLCEMADAIGGGVSEDLKIFGRYQDKVIPFGDILFDFKFGKPYNERTIDFLMSGPPGEQFASFEIETSLLLKDRFPDARVVCLIRNQHEELIMNLRKRYPQLEFPFENIMPLLEYMKDTKVYFNPELRPRPGRAMIEAYYCRTPFISYGATYFSKLCKEYSYDYMSIVDIVDMYEDIKNSNYNKIVSRMEERAKFDFFDPIYDRITKALCL